MHNNKKAFTLIELLVVVLIIGILTAIALPKYLFVVQRTKHSEALQLGRVILAAQERYYLIYGNYAENFDDLDIAVPITRKISDGVIDTNQFRYIITNQNNIRIEPLGKRYIDCFDIVYMFSQNRKSVLSCIYYDNEPMGKKICQSLMNNSGEPSYCYTNINGQQRCSYITYI